MLIFLAKFCSIKTGPLYSPCSSNSTTNKNRLSSTTCGEELQKIFKDWRRLTQFENSIPSQGQNCSHPSLARKFNALTSSNFHHPFQPENSAPSLVRKEERESRVPKCKKKNCSIHRKKFKELFLFFYSISAYKLCIFRHMLWSANLLCHGSNLYHLLLPLIHARLETYICIFQKIQKGIYTFGFFT